jgi:diguanylate cyclase (GGDEF)-like protein/PAS domain S-box-containing protein
LLYVSWAAEEVYGIDPTRVAHGKVAWSDVACEPDRELLIAAWNRALRSGSIDVEFRIVTASGQTRWIHSRGRTVLDGRGGAVRIDGISRDITERQNQIRKITHLRRIGAISGSMNREGARLDERNELFRAACRIAIEEGPFAIACLAIVDRAGDKLITVANCGLGPEELADLELDTESPGHSDNTALRALATRRPAFVNDLLAEESHNASRQFVIRRGCRSVISLPIVVSDCALGVICLFSKESNFFEPEEIQLLQDFAGNVAVALAHLDRRDKLKHLARYDLLTGLPNRTLFQEHLRRLVEEAPVRECQTLVAVIDISRFRSVNETFGWSAADLLLCEVARRLRAGWPEPNLLARVSADSFALVLTGVVAQGTADLGEELENSVSSVFTAPFFVDKAEIRIAVTVGVAASPIDGATADELFRNAEAAQKVAQQDGEHILFYSRKMNSEVQDSLLLETRLRRALESDGFELHYQPKRATASGRISGVEALLRWRDGEYVPPAKFIPILESSGMILQAGAWVVKRALTDASQWGLPADRQLRIAVNVSPVQLRQRDFVRRVFQAMETVPELYGRLDLEITESTIMRDLDENVRTLQALREMGVRVAVDDFGTGYSSLGYLAKLPVDEIKIDRSFITSMVGSAHSIVLVSTIISMAHALELKVTAEGVESEEQAELLEMLKCDELQGYLISRPLQHASMAAYLREGRTSSVATSEE